MVDELKGGIIMEKQIRYERLIEKIRRKYINGVSHSEKSDLILQWYDECKEINLWTYWQGRGHLDTTKILLVGQDWGCAWGSDDCKALPYVDLMNQGKCVRYMSEDNASKTNNNLRKLFGVLGYDIFATDEEDEKNKELFFTNLITGYRNRGTSGNLECYWIDEETQQHFRELVEILEPEVILCLGRMTYEGVLKSIGIREHIDNYNDYIDMRIQNPIEEYIGGKRISIYPLAHCGALGTLNRNKAKGCNTGGLEKQMDDWRCIAERLHDKVTIGSNTSKGRGQKGSKFWMQVVVEEEHLRQELNQKIGEDLQWISPLVDEEFEEYELQHKKVLEKIGIREDDAKIIFSFWPKRQPQWDGLAVSADGKTLYIVEAKAHLKELNSKISASNPESIKKIKESMRIVHDAYYPKGKFEAWLGQDFQWQFYQMGNRLTFLKYMQNVRFEKIENVKLVLLNFVEDITYKSTTEEDWIEHYKEVFEVMTGSQEVPDDVIVVYFKVRGRGIAVNPMTGKPIYRRDLQEVVYHHNFIGHEINDSLEFYPDDEADREIYCRKRHEVCYPAPTDCGNCSCFSGWEQGHGIECAWSDVTENGEDITIYHKDRYQEMERVDMCIEAGILSQFI